jgi:hypothetical protein
MSWGIYFVLRVGRWAGECQTFLCFSVGTYVGLCIIEIRAEMQADIYVNYPLCVSCFITWPHKILSSGIPQYQVLWKSISHADEQEYSEMFSSGITKRLKLRVHVLKHGFYWQVKNLLKNCKNIGGHFYIKRFRISMIAKYIISLNIHVSYIIPLQ